MGVIKDSITGQEYEIQFDENYDGLSITIYSEQMKSNYTVEQETLDASQNSTVPIGRDNMIRDAIAHLEQLR